MSKADEMFKKLDYEIEETRSNIFIGQDKTYFNSVFVFHKESKGLTIYKQRLNIKELKAINEKCKELGWL